MNFTQDVLENLKFPVTQTSQGFQNQLITSLMTNQSISVTVPAEIYQNSYAPHNLCKIFVKTFFQSRKFVENLGENALAMA